METIYSKQQFDGYTHRFIVTLSVDDDWRNDVNMNIYSNSDSYDELNEFINSKKTEKVVSFVIVHRASAEQDENASAFIEEVSKGW